MAIVHFYLKPLANDPYRFEALDVSCSSHHQAHGQSTHAKAVFLGLLVDQVLGFVCVDLVQKIGGHLCGDLCSLELVNEIIDQLESDLVTCASVFVPKRQVRSAQNIYVAQGDAGKVEALTADLLGVLLLDGSNIMGENEADDLRQLALDPGRRCDDFIPENEASAQHFLQQESRSHRLQLVKSLWQLQFCCHEFVV